ncbi:MAG: 50S ribosomal protein L21 [Oscillospiraceae bacterium]|jgi:large subunit ribosomal protein L21|nr:50S ribosomal protein L21 [Oscillospiraceae bacterium]
MYAIIETGGKQSQVQVGDIIRIEKLGVEEGADYTFDKVVAVNKDDKLTVGSPYTGTTVSAKVLKNGRGKKITVFTYKSKIGSSHKKQGHRQAFTQVEITAIN